jgi:hypothetical protein
VIEHDDVIETLTASGANKPLDDFAMARRER